MLVKRIFYITESKSKSTTCVLAIVKESKKLPHLLFWHLLQFYAIAKDITLQLMKIYFRNPKYAVRRL